MITVKPLTTTLNELAKAPAKSHDASKCPKCSDAIYALYLCVYCGVDTANLKADVCTGCQE